jgi:hypothetical protein
MNENEFGYVGDILKMSEAEPYGMRVGESGEIGMIVADGNDVGQVYEYEYDDDDKDKDKDDSLGVEYEYQYDDEDKDKDKDDSLGVVYEYQYDDEDDSKGVGESGEIGMIVDDGNDVGQVGEIKDDGVRVRESGEVGMIVADGGEVGNGTDDLSVVDSFGVGMLEPDGVMSSEDVNVILICVMVFLISPFLLYLAFKQIGESANVRYQADMMMV